MAEKFRPRQISDVIGQDMVKNLARRSLRNKKFPQFSLMLGPSGTGKSTMAEICGLSLTCENPNNGEPCCECKSCRDNLIALDSGKQTMNLCKLNMGAIERSDFKQTIKEVFTLQPAIGDSAVYIFEELQALTKDEQNILLEYISSMRKNIYVIGCTTEQNRLRQELRNRAIKFQFKQLRTDEALTLLKIVCKEKGLTSPPDDISKFLIRSVHNCPRELVNTIDFLSDADSMNQDTLNEFLGFVPNSIYISYLENCKKDSFTFVEWLDSVSESGYENIVRGIRDFVIDCYGYIYGDNKQYYNTNEKHRLKEVFVNIDEDKMISLMEHFNDCKYDNETSAKYCLIIGRRIFNSQSVKSIFKESNREASRAVMSSHSATKEIERNKPKANKIDEASLDTLLSGFKRVNAKLPNNVD